MNWRSVVHIENRYLSRAFRAQNIPWKKWGLKASTVVIKFWGAPSICLAIPFSICSLQRLAAPRIEHRPCCHNRGGIYLQPEHQKFILEFGGHICCIIMMFGNVFTTGTNRLVTLVRWRCQAWNHWNGCSRYLITRNMRPHSFKARGLIRLIRRFSAWE